jgi:hypothetical protein
MSILAAILDPSDNGFDIGDLSLLVGIIVAISALTATIVRWNARRVAHVRSEERAEMEKRIKAAVDFVAAKVQPRNGGHGWDDVHSKLDTVITRQSEVVGDLRYLRGRLDNHIDGHDHRGE